MVISKFFTQTSLSNESFASMSSRAFAASSGSPRRIKVSRLSTGVMSRLSPYQSRGVRLSGRSSS